MTLLVRQARIWLSLLVLILAIVASLQEPYVVVLLRESVFDVYQRLKPRPYEPVPVRIIDIDEESLSRFGQWPWPRTQVAQLVQAAHDAGATTIVFDLLLSEPDRLSSNTPSKKHSDLDWEQFAMEPERLVDNDEVLAKTIKNCNVVTGFALIGTRSSATPLLNAGFAYAGVDPSPFLPSYPGAVTTLPQIEQAARGNGALNVRPAAGGVIRRVPLLLKLQSQIVPGLAAEALRVAQDGKSYLIKSSEGGGAAGFDRQGGVSDVRIASMTIPTNTRGEAWIYFTRHQQKRYVPAWSLLDGSAPPKSLRGAIVLIGSTASGLQDLHTTPMGNGGPGIDIHAQLLEQAILNVHLIRPWWAKGVEVLMLILLSSLMMILGSRIGAIATACVGFAAVGAVFAASWYAFSEARLLIDPMFPAASVFAVYLVFSVLRHLQVEHEQRWIRKAFSSYVSPKLVRQLVEHPAQLTLSGERRELTFLFTDLEGFTSLVERSEPSQIVPVLNAYLDGVIRIAFDHDGTVDKIVGDAVHIMFGAPVQDPEHACRAIACALDIDRFARSFAADQLAKGVQFGRTRIGVNSGVAIVGNFGGDMLFDYTAHGDVVNTAARLESANKYFGTSICVSETTLHLCPKVEGRPVGAIQLKGKEQPVCVFEPLRAEDANSQRVARYMAAYTLMEDLETAAKDAFAAAVQHQPNDALARFHLDRLTRGETGTTIVLHEK